MASTLWLWVGFVSLVLILVALDLGVFHRGARHITVRDSLGWTAVWIVSSLLFSLFVYHAYTNHWLGAGTSLGLDGKRAALQFLTGYVVEKSLSLDNVFVIALIFRSFGIPDIYQHRVLFWGILGALLMRGLLIGVGAALIQTFAWTIYVFGGFLVITGVRMLFSDHEHVTPEENRVVRLARRVLPVTDTLDGQRFFTRVDGRRVATPLFIVLLLVESTDVVFAVDSVPAIFAITRDPFLVFTSNVFAILGLRSLYFAVAAAIVRFRFLKHSLFVILVFVGVKMLLSETVHISSDVSLPIILGVLVLGAVASVIFPAKADPPS